MLQPAGSSTTRALTVATRPSGPSPAYTVRYADGTEEKHGEGEPAFTLTVPDRAFLRSMLAGDSYRAGIAFIRGEFDAAGDLAAAVRFHKSTQRRGWRRYINAAAARLAPDRLETWFQTRSRAASNIRYHYDRSNAFYQQFLDARMVYSCAYFRTAEASLEDAQLEKLDLICRKLDLRPGERFLDVGCGWGALLIHAAGFYGVAATGCTLSAKQAEYARDAAREHVPGAPVAVHQADVRDVTGRFDKIASVGMFEHVGRHRLRGYFGKVHQLLAPGGLFLNHGIVRPEFVTDDAQTLFLRRRVFPGGELAHLSDIVRESELAGFEVLDVEDLRPHYARTCRAWVERLQRNASACLAVVDQATYRTWLLYLAGAAAGFEDGLTSVCQLLLGKRGSQRPHLTRDYMYSTRREAGRRARSV